MSISYEKRTYAMGEHVDNYDLTLSQRPALDAPFPQGDAIISLSFNFRELVPSYTDKFMRVEEPTIQYASIALKFDEAEQLARLLIYSLEKARLERKPAEIAAKRSDKAGTQAKWKTRINRKP